METDCRNRTKYNGIYIYENSCNCYQSYSIIVIKYGMVVLMVTDALLMMKLISTGVRVQHTTFCFSLQITGGYPQSEHSIEQLQVVILG